MSNPYRDPYSPEYREMQDAGRTPFGVYHLPRPYGGSPTCQASVLVDGERQWYTRCGEPIAAISIRGGLGQSYCVRHGIEDQDRGAAVHFHCSVCHCEVKWPSELDASGRGIECQP